MKYKVLVKIIPISGEVIKKGDVFEIQGVFCDENNIQIYNDTQKRICKISINALQFCHRLYN